MFVQIIDTKETKTITKKIICETKIFYILLVFFLITLALLIVVNIYFNLIKLYFTRGSKNKTKQKQKLITILRHK